MISKIASIKDFGVFQNFEWDRSVIDKVGQPLTLSKVNIIYGRNYSGKTTLSRVFGSLENRALPENYDNPKFTLALKGGTQITQTDLTKHKQEIRVFNEDFIKENLSFLFNNADGEITPFAILGADNAKVMKEIARIESELGSNIENRETGLFLEQLNLRKAKTTKQSEYNIKLNEIDDLLTKKARAIKDKHEIYGNHTYIKTNIKAELESLDKFTPLTDDEKELQLKLVKEDVKTIQPAPFTTSFFLEEYVKQATELLARKLETSNKIKELISDETINAWVKQGAGLMDGKKQCAFCGSTISDERWATIKAHFDIETQELEKEIDLLISKIEGDRLAIDSFSIDKNAFYLKHKDKIDEIVTNYQTEYKKYNKLLVAVVDKLKHKKANITEQVEFVIKIETDLPNVCLQYEALRSVNKDYAGRHATDQKTAKDKLRLQEVYEFKDQINYDEKLKTIHTLTTDLETAKTKYANCEAKIVKKQDELKANNRKLQDEEAGALAVNKYLTHDFGHSSLNLQAVKKEVEGKGKQIIFQIFRKDKPAYNLSGGEQNLIAFCYFLAKLKDINTSTKKPIIWIDDPITSLDGNHIFFIYSLIVSEIAIKDNFKQLFISTHNLDFLKYLQRIKNDNRCYLLVNQVEEDKSTIVRMPEYLSKYATEFNYLFAEIYNCSKLTTIDDTNYKTLYSFGNNARKFIEILMFYNYPYCNSNNKNELFEKMELYFGKDNIIVFERITNEYSHLAQSVERGAIPVETSEIITSAKRIIEALERNNKAQFDNLVKSVS